MALYEKIPYVVGEQIALLHCNRAFDKTVMVRRKLPGNIIVVHGVNDVGVSYQAVEDGLCAGLTERLKRGFQPANYRMPVAADKDTLEDDPEAVFYKRSVTKETNSPVIPFYWGYREAGNKTGSVNGQFVDRYGNRLDKDLAKEGGPFGNATSTIPDMWNKGIWAPVDVMGDALRPLKTAPGRLYMVLAAQRMAALIAMIRDYGDGETVTIVAHSQGCMLALLAQAMLMERGLAPADTLILTHPPYGLVENVPWKMKVAEIWGGGEDPVMSSCYERIDGKQTLHGRLQTLVNIVAGVANGSGKAPRPDFSGLNDNCVHAGMVGGGWKAQADRDNRGKVYLYFCPEDMTVALDNIQGIGWQGVPDYIEGSKWAYKPYDLYDEDMHKIGKYGYWTRATVVRRALQELGGHFYQRVFSNKIRLNPATGKSEVVLVGTTPPHDFPLRLRGEDEHAHVEYSGRGNRSQHPVAQWPIDTKRKPVEQRESIRTITGEALPRPVAADLRGAGQIDPAAIPPQSKMRQRIPRPEEQGPCEAVDPTDAAIALTGDTGLGIWVQKVPDPSGRVRYAGGDHLMPSDELRAMTVAHNKAQGLDTKGPLDQRKIIQAIHMETTGDILATIQESPNEARLRWQKEVSAKSFHSSIIGNPKNHAQVTAYDVAIGSGGASSDPKFYAYLCMVADWRLKRPKKDDRKRPGIAVWDVFVAKFSVYWNVEPAWRKEIIDGNVDYYSTGNLPACIPLLGGPLWEIIISQIMDGKEVSGKKPHSDSH